MKTSDRASLGAETLRNYLHVSQNMPALESFDPSIAAQDCLKAKERRTKQLIKAKQQEWFMGMYNEAEASHKSQQEQN